MTPNNGFKVVLALAIILALLAASVHSTQLDRRSHKAKHHHRSTTRPFDAVLQQLNAFAATTTGDEVSQDDVNDMVPDVVVKGFRPAGNGMFDVTWSEEQDTLTITIPVWFNFQATDPANENFNVNGPLIAYAVQTDSPRVAAKYFDTDWTDQSKQEFVSAAKLANKSVTQQLSFAAALLVQIDRWQDAVQRTWAGKFTLMTTDTNDIADIDIDFEVIADNQVDARVVNNQTFWEIKPHKGRILKRKADSTSVDEDTVNANREIQLAMDALGQSMASEASDKKKQKIQRQIQKLGSKLQAQDRETPLYVATLNPRPYTTRNAVKGQNDKSQFTVMLNEFDVENRANNPAYPSGYNPLYMFSSHALRLDVWTVNGILTEKISDTIASVPSDGFELNEAALHALAAKLNRLASLPAHTFQNHMIIHVKGQKTPVKRAIAILEGDGVKQCLRPVFKKGLISSNKIKFLVGSVAEMWTSYSTDVQYCTAAHEFGHMIGFHDEYGYACDDAHLDQLVTNGELSVADRARAGAGGSACDQIRTAIRDCNLMGIPLPSQDVNLSKGPSRPKYSNSIMNAGTELSPYHYLQFARAWAVALGRVNNGVPDVSNIRIFNSAPGSARGLIDRAIDQCPD